MSDYVEYITEVADLAALKEAIATASCNTAVVIYHKGCLDGVASAAVVCQSAPYSKYLVLPVAYNEVDTAEWMDFAAAHFTNHDVYIVDFSFPEAVMEAIADACANLYWFDHHISAIRKCEAFLNAKQDHVHVVLSMNNSYSGVGITWDFFNPGHALPDTLAAIEDRDLWRFTLPDTEEYCAALYLHTSSVVDFLKYVHDNSPRTIKSEGTALLEARRQRISKYTSETGLERISYITVSTYSAPPFVIPVINCPYEIVSEVGNYWAKQYPIILLYEIVAQQVRISLRSAKEHPTPMDCSVVASTYFSGGGHKHAAGGKMSVHKFFDSF